AATGMKALADHLGETGDTYGGLEASDIGGPPVPLPTPTPPVSPSPPTPPSGPPIVPPSGPPTVPPSGPPVVPPSGPPSGPPRGVSDSDAQKYLELSAKSAGISIEEFVKTLRKAANEGAAAIKDGLAKAQIELNRGIIEASANFSKITTPSSVLQKELDALADQLKAVDDKDPDAKTKREDLREQIREKQGELGRTQSAESGIREALISQIKAASVGKSESEITSVIESALKSLEANTLSSNAELQALLSRTLDTKDATDIAGRAAAGQYGNADLILQATGDLTDTSTNFQKAVEYFGGPLKATTRSMLLASSAIQAGSKAFLESGILSKQAIEAIGPTLAGISGGVSGGAQSAAVVAELDIGKNAQSFGKILEGFGGRLGTAGQFLQTFSGSLQAGAIAFALVSGAIKG
ncbi:MAG: hypothetical protein ACK53L_05245, partial [Pirellulaceae bacterium]